LMLLRIQTPDGVKRVSLDPFSTIIDLKNKIFELVGAAPHEQVLVFRDLDNSTTINLDDDNKTLENYGLKKNNMIALNIVKEVIEEPSISFVKKNNYTNNSYTNNNKEEVDVEDEIDKILRKEDGWVKREKTRYCQHGDNASCNRCISIAPWLILSHEPWQEQKIKHIPFHAWVKETQYRSGSNTRIPLHEQTFKMEKTGKITSKQILNSTVTINRQPYRHVDYVTFEDGVIIDSLLSGWRKTGFQRGGFLIGTYTKDKSIPLGIKAKVCGIYEPPQQSTEDKIVLLKDPNSEKFDRLLRLFGLQRVGFIWTSIKTNEKKK